jgi:hypothetical protein
MPQPDPLHALLTRTSIMRAELQDVLRRFFDLEGAIQAQIHANAAEKEKQAA